MRKTKVKKNNYEESGITLIALVITIILMLILVVLTILLVVKGNLFEYARKATFKMENAINMEQQFVTDITDKYKNPSAPESNKPELPENEVPNLPENEETKELPEGIKVGDYVNYTPMSGTYKVVDGTNGTGYKSKLGYQEFTTETGEKALKWRVLSIDSDKSEIEIVAEKAAQVSTKLYLKGADGYNHAVDILNDLCEALYSNGSEAIARSINAEDINEKTTYDYTKYTGNFKYGDTKQLKKYGLAYMKYPNLYSQEKGFGTKSEFNNTITGIDEYKRLDDGVIDENGLTTYTTVTGIIDGNVAGTDPYTTYTYYTYNVENYLDTNLGINTAPKGLLNISTIYWLASRCVYAYSNYDNFGARCIEADGTIKNYFLVSSGGYEYEPGYAIRPVVTINSNASWVIDETNSTDTITYWNVQF